jgi:hypothetical protein
MKKIMMIAAMMVAAVTANAQNEVGQITLQPKVGLNIASNTGTGNKSKAGFAAGVEAEYGVAENFGVTVGALYSMQGTKASGETFDDEGGKVKSTIKFNVDYFNIPILVQYYPIQGLAIKAGVQFGFVVRNKAKLDVTASGETYKDDGSVNEFLDDCKTLGLIRNDDAKLNKFDFSIPVGLSYEYQNFVLDARYNIGVSKVIKNYKDKNSVFQITLGYKFAL